MTRNALIVLAGPIGAGKTTAARYLSSKYETTHKSFVDTLWKPILEERGLPITRATLQELGAELMSTWGPRGMVDRMLNSLHPDHSYVIDDVRDPDVYKYLESRAQESYLLFLDTDLSSRFPRLKIRDGVSDISEQQQADQASTETNIHLLRDIADFVVNNEGNEDMFYSKLDNVAVQIGLTLS